EEECRSAELEHEGERGQISNGAEQYELERPGLEHRVRERARPPTGEQLLAAMHEVHEVAGIRPSIEGRHPRRGGEDGHPHAAGMGSFAHALVEQHVASSEGLAKTLAARYQMPLVDLALTGVAEDASGEIALHVLERLVAIPYAFDNGTLRVAIADPGNIQGIDELRLATRYPLDLGVASREDIFAEIRRLARASEAFGARAAVEEELAATEDEEEADDLEIDDGISDAPLVRLVNSVIFQAAEDGASDVHFEPQEDSLLVRFRIDGVLQEVQRIPKRMMPG